MRPAIGPGLALQYGVDPMMDWHEVYSLKTKRWHLAANCTMGLRGMLWYSLLHGEKGLAPPKRWRRKPPRYIVAHDSRGKLVGAFKHDSPEGLAAQQIEAARQRLEGNDNTEGE